MDNQNGFEDEFNDGFDHSLEKRTIKEFFDKLFSPWCKAFPKSLGCPKPEEPVETPPATTPTPAPAPVATSPPAVVAPPPVETKTQPASPPAVTQPPAVVAPPATTSHAVAKSSTTSTTPQPTKGAEQGPVSNPGTGSSEGSGSSNGEKGNAGNAGSGDSGSGHENTGPIGSENGNNAAVPPPSITLDKGDVQPTATSGSHPLTGVLPGKVLLAAPVPAASHASESGGQSDGNEGGNEGGNDSSKDGDSDLQGSHPSPTSHHSAIQHNNQNIPTTLSTAWIVAGTPTDVSSGAGESTVPGQVAGSDDPLWVNPELNPTPGSTHTQAGGGSTTSDTPTTDAPKTSTTGLVPGIAGGVVTIVVLFLILFALLFKYRRTARVQNFLIKFTPLKVAAYTKRDKKRSSMGKGLLYEDEPSSPTSPTMQEKGKGINYGTILPAPVTQPTPTACRSSTKATHEPPVLDTTHGTGSPRSPTPDSHSIFERAPTGMSDYFIQPPSPTHSNHSGRDARNSVDSLGGVSIASSGIFSPSMMSWPMPPPSTADSASITTSPPNTSYSQATHHFQPLQPTPPLCWRSKGKAPAPAGLSIAPREGQADPSKWQDRPDSWGF
ncbi:hypothetical protein B0T20DRAFT_347823 [Sordaria brevicollis]|uniref:Uncharacterized protein n=1 Tax=Sordaria brevicollis TaxID=83679 RepID=A0AAE0PIF0_SORBR|nr:hypothetical protein B0T20DRAFT_347823 [Sordaria brevicollis]